MYRQYYEIQSFRFSLATDQKQLEPYFNLFYPALFAAPGDCAVHWSVRQTRSASNGLLSYTIFEDDVPVCETLCVNQLLEDLEWGITIRILHSLRHFLQFHASGIAKDGNALLLVGPSGTGKTSMALSMLLQGWRCFSDEVILMETENYTIWPFPRNFHVDSNTFKGLFNDVNDEFIETYQDASGKARFNPSIVRPEWIANSSKPGWIVFPQYSPVHQNELVPLGETEALSKMIGEVINLKYHKDRGIKMLVNLIQQCSCFTLKASSFKGASHALSALMSKSHTVSNDYSRDRNLASQ